MFFLYDTSGKIGQPLKAVTVNEVKSILRGRPFSCTFTKCATFLQSVQELFTRPQGCTWKFQICFQNGGLSLECKQIKENNYYLPYSQYCTQCENTNTKTATNQNNKAKTQNISKNWLQRNFRWTKQLSARQTIVVCQTSCLSDAD